MSVKNAFLYSIKIFYYNILLINIFLNKNKDNKYLINPNLIINIIQLKIFGVIRKMETKVIIAIVALDGNSHNLTQDLELLF